VADRAGARPTAGRFAVIPSVPLKRRVPLTRRERQALTLLASGSANSEIAHRLGVTEHDVETQFDRMLSKTGTQSRLELVIYGLRNGIGL
jgi:DNA-binding NarL/FixJ family response regulator